MNKPTLTIFANFYIDSTERFLRMKDSFMSFYKIDIEKWVINIRGKYKKLAKDFIEEHLNNEVLKVYELESYQGWFHDSKIMSKDINTEYVLFWIEDHICLQPNKILPTIQEMKHKNIDTLNYSFCYKDQALKYYGNQDIINGEELDWFEHTVDNNSLIQKNIASGVRLVSAVSITKSNLFKKILFENKKFIWPKETPFDFEVAPSELHFLPIKRGIPKNELFASIDDDNAVPNTCLISRKLYPARITGKRMTATSLDNQSLFIEKFDSTVYVKNQKELSLKDILLVNPDYSIGEVFKNNAHLPVGLAFIAQSVEDNLYSYDICDLTVQKVECLWSLLNTNKYKYIGFGMMSFRVENTYSIIHQIKQLYPLIKIIIGGPHVIASKEKIFDECNAIDILVRGEGEETIIEILKGELLENIKGIYYKKSNGNIIKSEDKGYLKDFNNITFPKYNKFNLDLYPKFMYLASSRGCPYKCTFCGAPEFLGKKWRKKESNKMFEEFYYWYNKGYRRFKFEDSLFSADKTRIFEFCELVIKLNDKEVSFSVDGARCDHFNYDLLSAMKKAGFKELTFGVESANDHVLKNFKKGETFKQIDDTIAIADELDFRIGMFFIIGGPDETVEDVERSFQFALKYKNTTFVYFFELTPVKGTPYYDYAIEQKYIANETPYPSGNFGFNDVAKFGNNKMTKEEMSKVLKKARVIEREVRFRYKRLYDQKKNITVSKDLNYFYDIIEILKQKDEQYLIYGYGKTAKILEKFLAENVLAFIDLHKQGKSDTNKTIIHPNLIKKFTFDKIIISVLGREENIMDDLINNYCINKNKITLLEF